MPTRCRFVEGFTLLEVLVALVVLSTGILGLAANAALVSRLVGHGSRLTVAAAVATARLEQLRALPCVAVTPGTAVTRGIEERWTATPMGPAAEPRALEVELSLTYRLRTSHSADPVRMQRFRGSVPCG
jgi:prepilin-type N-terminal cleavage/methylation domain-containing protein